MNKDDNQDAAPPKDPLIEAIRERVNAYLTGAAGHHVLSLRELSRRIGMSAAGLQNFAGGTMPYTTTRRKLTRWYKSLAPATRDEQRRDALAMLLADLRASQRAEAERRILSIISEYEPAPPESAHAPRRRSGRRTERTVGDATA